MYCTALYSTDVQYVIIHVCKITTVAVMANSKIKVGPGTDLEMSDGKSDI